MKNITLNNKARIDLLKFLSGPTDFNKIELSSISYNKKNKKHTLKIKIDGLEIITLVKKIIII